MLKQQAVPPRFVCWLLPALVYATTAQAMTDDQKIMVGSFAVESFVVQLDKLFQNEAITTFQPYDQLIETHLRNKKCDIDAIAAIAKRSRFFHDVYDWGAGYTVSFRSQSLRVMFGIEKSSGELRLPAALPVWRR